MHNGVYASGFVQILHIGAPSGGQVAEVGGLFADRVGNIQVDFNAALVGNGRQVKHGIGGAAQGHVHSKGVVKSLFCHNVSRADVLFHHVHHCHARVFCQLNPSGVHSGNGAVALQAHAQHFCEAVHGVSGIHTGAGATAGAGFSLVFPKLFFRDLTGVELTHRLRDRGEAGFASVYMAGQHRSAADKHGRQVQPGSGHQQARDVFVAVGHHYQGVEAVGHGHGFGRVGNQVTGNQGVLHAHMAHSNAVAHGDGREHNGGSPGHGHAQLYRVHDFVNVHVPRHNLVIAADNAYQRPGDLLFGEAQGVVQRPVGGVLGRQFDFIAYHSDFSLLKITGQGEAPP